MGHKISRRVKYIHKVKALGTGHWCMYTCMLLKLKNPAFLQNLKFNKIHPPLKLTGDYDHAIRACGVDVVYSLMNCIISQGLNQMTL